MFDQPDSVDWRVSAEYNGGITISLELPRNCVHWSHIVNLFDSVLTRNCELVTCQDKNI